MPRPFVHLHLHTEYSLLDGAIKHNPLFERAKALQAAGRSVAASTSTRPLHVPVVVVSVLELAADVALSWQLAARAFLRQRALSDVLHSKLQDGGSAELSALANAAHAVEQLAALGIVSVEDLLQFDAGLLHGELAEQGVHVTSKGGSSTLLQEQHVQAWLNCCKALIESHPWLVGL